MTGAMQTWHFPDPSLYHPVEHDAVTTLWGEAEGSCTFLRSAKYEKLPCPESPPARHRPATMSVILSWIEWLPVAQWHHVVAPVASISEVPLPSQAFF